MVCHMSFEELFQSIKTSKVTDYVYIMTITSVPTLHSASFIPFALPAAAHIKTKIAVSLKDAHTVSFPKAYIQFVLVVSLM